MHPLRKAERGAAPVVTIIAVLILAIAVYAGFQIGMLQLTYMNIKEKIKAEMIYALVPPYTDIKAKVNNKIIEALKAANAQYSEEQIMIEVSNDSKSIRVKVWFAKSHSLPLYQNPKQFYIELDHRAPSI